jgi:hypothetical protein
VVLSRGVPKQGQKGEGDGRRRRKWRKWKWRKWKWGRRVEADGVVVILSNMV